MIRIAYTSPNELDISGSGQDLKAVRCGILDVSQRTTETCSIIADTKFDPYPYSNALASIRIEVSKEPVCISVVDNDVVVSGSESNLEVFASFFDLDDSAPEGCHLHHEYHEGNEWVHKYSVPLVITHAKAC